MSQALKSYMDLVNECDVFPQEDSIPSSSDFLSRMYRFQINGDPRTHGYMLPDIVAKMPWTLDFIVDHVSRTVTLCPVDHPKTLPRKGSKVTLRFDLDESYGLEKGVDGEVLGHVRNSDGAVFIEGSLPPDDLSPVVRFPDNEGTNMEIPIEEWDWKINVQLHTTALTRLIELAIERDTFQVIHKTPSEQYPIIGANFRVSLQRYSANLFGIISRGAHLTVYSNTKEGMKIWVPQRSPTLFTYPNCLDTTVAGGVEARETPFSCIIREAEEEASLPAALVSTSAKACGCISYIGLNSAGDGGEQGLFAPDVVYVYDLEVDEEIQCKPHDEEVKEFHFLTVEEVKVALASGVFKKNSALVMIDFFIRHGIITAENEERYAEIVQRLHRKLPLPTGPDPDFVDDNSDDDELCVD